MRRYFTQYWTNESADGAFDKGLTLIDHTAGGESLDAVGKEDSIYVITVTRGILVVYGKLLVGEVTDYETAARRLSYQPYDGDSKHFFPIPGTVMEMSYNPVESDVAAKLEIIRRDGIRPPKILENGWLDRQTLTGVCEITSNTASILDSYLTSNRTETEIDTETEMAGEDSDAEDFADKWNRGDGTPQTFLGTRYERLKSLRSQAVRLHGTTCFACGFSFEEMYGDIGKGFTEVHHVFPLASVGEAHPVNPLTDLVPLCANCHRMIHRNPKEPLTVDQLVEIVEAYFDKISAEDVHH
jgi:5-methylcytosine-specific restriction enzyme A